MKTATLIRIGRLIYAQAKGQYITGDTASRRTRSASRASKFADPGDATRFCQRLGFNVINKTGHASAQPALTGNSPEAIMTLV